MEEIISIKAAPHNACFAIRDFRFIVFHSAFSLLLLGLLLRLVRVKI
jgi:hypothetical protein